MLSSIKIIMIIIHYISTRGNIHSILKRTLFFIISKEKNNIKNRFARIFEVCLFYLVTPTSLETDKSGNGQVWKHDKSGNTSDKSGNPRTDKSGNTTGQVWKHKCTNLETLLTVEC